MVTCDFRDGDFDPKTPCAGVVDVVAGNDATCVMLDTGRWACWGANSDGQIALPAGVDSLPLTLAFYAGCAVQEDGKPLCWGGNVSGSPTSKPTQGLDHVVSVSNVVGYETMCALREDGTVRCWGQGTAADS